MIVFIIRLILFLGTLSFYSNLFSDIPAEKGVVEQLLDERGGAQLVHATFVQEENTSKNNVISIDPIKFHSASKTK